ncbi:hypothetical protein SAMN04487981_12757 [Streptomyces sp. cf386]|uniref:luciferase family protein n=1 Tax=Streptomyces sp. cf386 TaxID=1761904 RepID=UPI000883C5DE|nr:luciferase family protein [Streptomyces sp. cf386]SDP57720.1 hypothetical protein SAMN04487981_12757 [Streptomyces sp. cf386]
MVTARCALTQFASRRDLAETRPSCGTGRALRSAGAENAHFHSGRQVDMHLTARMIHHFDGGLRHSPSIQLVPGSHW